MTTSAALTTDLAAAAAHAAAAVLPSVEPLEPGLAQPGTEQVTSAFAGAAVAELHGALSGRIAVLVTEELVDALAASPLGGLDLAAATQPALDAVAAQLGASAHAARTTSLELVVADMGGSFTSVPLIGTGVCAAVLIADETLSAAQAASFRDQAAADVPTAKGATHGAAGTAPVFTPVAPSPRGIEMLHGVIMEVTVEIGRTRMSVRDLLALTPGTVLELDRAAGSPADLLVNGRLIARGEVVVVDEDFGLRITEIVDGQAAV